MNLRFVTNKPQICSYANHHPKENGIHWPLPDRRSHRIAAVETEDGGWCLFGVWRDQDIAVFVEAVRGGIREWSGLDYLTDFVANCGIVLWEVHNRTKRQSPT